MRKTRWISSDGEHAIELTWRMPSAAYFGIAYTLQQAAILHPAA
jgi:hypothetical protein